MESEFISPTWQIACTPTVGQSWQVWLSAEGSWQVWLSAEGLWMIYTK